MAVSPERVNELLVWNFDGLGALVLSHVDAAGTGNRFSFVAFTYIIYLDLAD